MSLATHAPGCCPQRDRVLCLCRGGNVRSAGCAYILKWWFGIDAVAASLERNHPDTLFLLMRNWATKIIVVGERDLLEAANLVPSRPEAVTDFPLTHYDVGKDVWGNPLHPDLLLKLIPHMLADPHWDASMKSVLEKELKAQGGYDGR